MSSATLPLSAPLGAPEAAGALVVLTAAAAGVLVVEAVKPGGDRAVTAVTDAAAEYGRALEEAAEAQARGAIDARIWERVAGNVFLLNTRITMLGDRVWRAGAAVELPEPLALTGLNAVQAAAWCVRAEGALVEAQFGLHDAVTAAQVDRTAVSELESETAVALKRYREMLVERLRPRTMVGPPPISVTDAEVERVLLRLDPDADESQQELVLTKAVLVRGTNSGERSPYMYELRHLVRSIGVTVAARRLAGQWQAALAAAVLASGASPDSHADVASKLRAVVVGVAELTEELRAEAAEALAAAARSAQASYVRELVHRELVDAGYSVEGVIDAEPRNPAWLRRSGWGAEYRVKVWMGQGDVLHTQVQRTGPAADDEDARIGRAHCDEFDETLRRIGRRLRVEVTFSSDAPRPADGES